MLIGIIDCDLFINRKTFLPNPEVMLLSSYHKKKGDIVHLLMNGKNLKLYNKIYIRRNKKGQFNFPQEIYSWENVDCGGLYFNNGIINKIPEEIFKCEPDKTIYDSYVKYWGNTPIKGVKTLERANYISLRKGFPPLGGAGANYLYDYDLGKKEDFIELQKLYGEKYFKKLHSYYPIQCDDLDIAINFSKQQFLTKLNKIWITKELNYEDIKKMQKANLRIPITAYITNKTRFYSQKELDELFTKSIDLILFCIINDVKVNFKINPYIRVNDQFRLLRELCDWSCATMQPSFYNFCTKKDKFSIEEFIYKYPNTKNLFFIEPHKFKNEGGIWLYGRRYLSN